jgi:hypothetical protein
MMTFNVGDKVRVVTDSVGPFERGDEGTIAEIADSGSWPIRVRVPGRYADRPGYFAESEIEEVVEEKAEDSRTVDIDKVEEAYLALNTIAIAAGLTALTAKLQGNDDVADVMKAVSLKMDDALKILEAAAPHLEEVVA